MKLLLKSLLWSTLRVTMLVLAIILMATTLAYKAVNSKSHAESVAFVASANYYRGCVDGKTLAPVAVTSGNFCKEGAINAGAEVYEILVGSKKQ